MGEFRSVVSDAWRLVYFLIAILFGIVFTFGLGVGILDLLLHNYLWHTVSAICTLFLLFILGSVFLRKPWINLSCFLMLGLVLGAGCSFTRIARHWRASGTVDRYQSANISGTVASVYKFSRRATRVLLNDVGIEGKNYSSGSFFCYGHRCRNLLVGDRVSFTGRASSFLYREYGSKSNYFVHIITKPVVSGYVKSSLEVLHTGSLLSVVNIFHKFRNYTEKRALSAGGDLDGKGLMLAISTGNQSLLNKESLESMRYSGLAHILAISGLHIAIITSFIFLLFRKFLAFFSNIYLFVNTKKLSAVVAILFGLFYLILAGAPISAIRSFSSFAVAMLGILVDRKVMPLRVWAIVAISVLLFYPEKLFMASFQMSFLATFALITGFINLNRLRGLYFRSSGGFGSTDGDVADAVVLQTGKGVSTIRNATLLSNSDVVIGGGGSQLLKPDIADYSVGKLVSCGSSLACGDHDINGRGGLDKATGGNIVVYPVGVNNFVARGWMRSVVLGFLRAVSAFARKLLSGFRVLGLYVVGTIFGSILVSVFLFAIEAYHFGYLSFGGLLSNIFAIPVIEFFVLPLSFGAVILSGTGFDLLVYNFVSYVAKAVLVVAKLVASVSFARVDVHFVTPSMLLFIVVGLMIASRANVAGVVLGLCLLAVGTFCFRRDYPALIFSGKGDLAAYNKDGKYYWFGNSGGRGYSSFGKVKSDLGSLQSVSGIPAAPLGSLSVASSGAFSCYKVSASSNAFKRPSLYFREYGKKKKNRVNSGNMRGDKVFGAKSKRGKGSALGKKKSLPPKGVRFRIPNGNASKTLPVKAICVYSLAPGVDAIMPMRFRGNATDLVFLRDSDLLGLWASKVEGFTIRYSSSYKLDAEFGVAIPENGLGVGEGVSVRSILNSMFKPFVGIGLFGTLGISPAPSIPSYHLYVPNYSFEMIEVYLLNNKIVVRPSLAF